MKNIRGREVFEKKEKGMFLDLTKLYIFKQKIYFNIII